MATPKVRFIVAILVASVAPLPDGSSVRAQGALPLDSGTIAGVVIDASSGRPLPDARITIAGPQGFRATASSAENGKYEFRGLAKGRYSLGSELPGYMRGAFGRLRPDGRSGDIDLLDRQHIVDAHIRMWRFAVIGGRVVDAANNPLPRVAVRALRRVVQGGAPTFVPAWAGMEVGETDGSGVYRFAKLPPGEYVISVPARLNTTRTAATEPAADPTASPTPGTAVDRRYHQIGDFVLTLPPRAPAPAPPGKDGRILAFQTTFYPGTPILEAAVPILVGAGDERLGTDVQLDAITTHTVAGRLVGPNGPLASVSIQLVRDANATLFDDPAFAVSISQTDEKGEFFLAGIPSGNFRLRSLPRVATTGTLPVNNRYWVNEQILVADQPLQALQPIGRRVATLAGRIELPSAVTKAQVTVIVEPLDRGVGPAINPKVSENMSFATELLPSRYVVAGFVDARVCRSIFRGRDVSDEPLIVTDEDVSDLVIDCNVEPTRIQGDVRTQRGESVRDARVVVFSTDRQHWSGPGRRPRRVASASSSPNGTFSLANLPAGDYFVVAVQDDVANWEEASVMERLSASAQRVSLRDGLSQTVNIRLATIK